MAIQATVPFPNPCWQPLRHPYIQLRSCSKEGRQHFSFQIMLVYVCIFNRILKKPHKNNVNKDTVNILKLTFRNFSKEQVITSIVDEKRLIPAEWIYLCWLLCLSHGLLSEVYRKAKIPY